MRINKLILEGKNYRRTLYFTDGLNIIEGDFMSGKSLVLELIKFCLGGKQEKINRESHVELFSYCDTIYLEITNQTQNYTVKRYLKKEVDSVFLYICDFENINNYLSKKYKDIEFCEFLYELLNIKKLFLIKNKSHSKEKVAEKISFRDIFRYIYIPQHEFGTNNFLGSIDYFKKNKNYKTCEIILGLTNYNNEKINTELINLENKVTNNTKIIEGFKQHIQNINLDEDELDKELKKAQEEILELNIRKNRIKSGELTGKKSIYSDLIETKTELFKKKAECDKNIQEIKLYLTGNKILHEDYLNEKKIIEATMEGMYNIKLDSHYGICPLCQSNLKHVIETEEDSQLTVEKLKKNNEEIEGKISLISYLNSRKESKRLEYEKELNEIEKKLNEIEIKEKTYLDNAKIPFLNEIELLNETLRDVEERKRNFEKEIEYYNLIRKYKDKNENLKIEKERLKKHLEINEEEKRKVLESINKLFEKTIGNFSGLNKDLVEIKSDYLPYYNGASILKHTSGGLLSALSIAYLGTVIKTSIEHPKILMLDTIGKYLGTENKSEIKDKKMYEEIYDYLIELGLELQIILVDNTPPKIMDKYVKYTFHQGIENGLINIKANEK